MNFSQAVRGQLTRSGAIRGIQIQAETELGRKLNKEEEAFLFFCHFTKHAIESNSEGEIIFF